MIGSIFSCARAQVGHWKSEISRISTLASRLPRRAPFAAPRVSRSVFAGSEFRDPAEADDEELLGCVDEAVVGERAVRRHRGVMATALRPSGSGNGATVAVIGLAEKPRGFLGDPRAEGACCPSAAGSPSRSATCCVFGEWSRYFCVPQYLSALAASRRTL